MEVRRTTARTPEMQHLRIKAFQGRSENAERAQIRAAVRVYPLVAIVRKQLKSEATKPF